MERLAMMYTNINMCGVLLFSYMPIFVQDIIRASTLLILVAVSTVWLSGNVLEVYHDLFDSFTPRILVIPDSIKTGIMVCYDILFHIVPCLILGLPYHIISYFIAYGIMLLWFIMIRNRLSYIYSPKISFKRGIIIAGILGIIVAIWIGYIQ